MPDTLKKELEELELRRREERIRKREEELEFLSGNLQTAHDLLQMGHLSQTQTIEKVSKKVVESLAAETYIHVNDCDNIAAKVAEKMKGAASPHICPFNEETIISLKALGAFYSKTESAFKTFIIGLIVIGLAAAFLIGLRNQIKAFWATL